jgi:hypothetical protein
MRRGDGRARPVGGRGLTAAASAQRALAAAQKKVYDGKWHNSALLHSESRGSPSLRSLYRAAETAWMDTRLARSIINTTNLSPYPPLPKRKKGGRG